MAQITTETDTTELSKTVKAITDRSMRTVLEKEGYDVDMGHWPRIIKAVGVLIAADLNVTIKLTVEDIG